MTIYPPRPPSFTCAICGEFQDWSDTGRRRWWTMEEAAIPPICRTCERDLGKAIGGWGDRNRDRRITRQISALAAMMEVEAHRIQNGKAPLYGRT